MRFRQGVRTQLGDRYRRLHAVHFDLHGDEARYLLDYIESVPALRQLVRGIEDAEPELDE